jgi:hypothetical protein
MRRVSNSLDQAQYLVEWFENAQRDPRWWTLTPEQQQALFDRAKYERMAADWLLDLYDQNVYTDDTYVHPEPIPALLLNSYDSSYNAPIIVDSSPEPLEPFEEEVDSRAVLRNLLNPENLFGANPNPPRVSRTPKSKCPYCNQHLKNASIESHLERENAYRTAGVIYDHSTGQWRCVCGKNFSTLTGLGQHSLSCYALRSALNRYP